MESSTSGTVPRALDVLAILGLLQLIYEVTVPIIHKAEQVYYHKKKCRTFGRKIAEIQNTLKAAKLDLFEDLYKNQKFNKFVKERLNELKETLSHAEQLVGELQSRRKGIAARISGEASSRIDAYERDIGESINLLNFHLVVMLLSEFSAAQSMSPDTHHQPFSRNKQQMLHTVFRENFPAAFGSPPAHHQPHIDPEIATSVHRLIPPRNSFRFVSPIHIPPVGFPVQGYDPETANQLFHLISTTENP